MQILVLLICATLSQSCEKDKPSLPVSEKPTAHDKPVTTPPINSLPVTEQPGNNPLPVTPTHLLEVQFTQGTLNIASVDSVVAEITANGSTQVDTVKLSRVNNLYMSDNQQLTSGKQVRISVYYPKTSTDQAGRLYRTTATITNKNNAVLAPTGKLADSWTPAIMLFKNNYHIQVIVPENPAEHWYEIKGPKNSAWNYLYMDRQVFLNNKTINTEAVWQDVQILGTTLFAKGNIVDYKLFKPFSDRMTGKNWTEADFFCSLHVMGATTAQEVDFYYKYNKRN